MLKQSLINPLNVFYIGHLLLMIDKSFVDSKFSEYADRLSDELNHCIGEFHKTINGTAEELPLMDDLDKRTQELVSIVESAYNSLNIEAKNEIYEIIIKMEKFHRGKMKSRN